MRAAALLALVLAAYASAPVAEGGERAVFAGYAVGPVRRQRWPPSRRPRAPFPSSASQRPEAF